MTIAEYVDQSQAKDKSDVAVEVPKVDKPSDMVYVPQPTYKIVRYNNPPGSPDISLNGMFKARRQANAQGIVSPDYQMLVYPSVYYYPESASTSCDLFVIPLDQSVGNLERIMTANVIKREQTPILSTDKAIDNEHAFRTLTPIDFSADSSKLLVKEKIGSSADGIWQTTAIVYDFETKNSYKLVEVRDAIIYYWRENKGLNLDDKRWDIYPLGFDTANPDRVIVNAYAYTGDTPVNLGIWSVDYKGEQSRLVTFDNAAVQVGMNGVKIVQDGVVPPSMLADEEKQQKKIEQADDKQKAQDDKAQLQDLKSDYKQNLKDIDAGYKQDQQQADALRKINSTTSMNENEQKYQEVIDKLNAQQDAQQAKKDALEQKINDKKQQADDKRQQLLERVQQQTQAKQDAELEQIRNLPAPAPLDIPPGIFDD